MSAAWIGTLGTLAEGVRTGNFLVEVTESFRKYFGEPSRREIAAWKGSIPALVEGLAPVASPSVLVILEFPMPAGAERADVLLLGGNAEKPKAAVIEIKQWRTARVDPASREVFAPGDGRSQHPALQVLNYRGKLHLFHALGQDYEITPYVLAPNMTRST
jgi:hypothetical protein